MTAYKPHATLPIAFALTDRDTELQFEDVPNDEPNKLFGYRAGLGVHPLNGSSTHPEGAAWERGTASNQNNWLLDRHYRAAATYHRQWD